MPLNMIRKTFLFIFIFQSVLLQFVLGAGLQDYQSGWSAYNENDRAEARKLFTSALSDSDRKPDALLSLCLLDWNESRYDEAFNHFRQFYESGNNPYPYLYAISGLPFIYESDHILSPDKIGFLEKIVEDPKMNGTLKAMFYERIGSHYQKINDFDKAKTWYDKMGAINKWQVLGSFDNTSGSGFSKDWGAVANATTEHIFKNKVDAEVKWYTPTCNKPNNWFYFDYYFYLDDAVMYAQSFVTSPIAQDVYLRAGTSGSLKIWVNDGLVASVPEERNCDLDIYAYKAKLNQGVNRILVQIGQSEISNANFLVRLTDVDANTIPSLIYSANYADYVKSDQQTPGDMLPFFAEAYFSEKMAKEPSNPLNQILLSEVYLRNDKAYEATKVLKGLESEAPKSTLVSMRLAEAYSRANNQTDYDRVCEKIKQEDPNSFYAFQLKYNDAVNSEKYSDAEEVLKKALELYGENEITDDWAIRNNAYLKKYPELMSLGKEMYKKYPDSYKYMNLEYQIEKAKDPKSAINILGDYCQKYFNTDAMGLLASAYVEQGENGKGLDVLRKRIKNMPYAIGYYVHLSSTLSDMQKYKESISISDQALELSPYISNIYNSRGFAYKNLKDEKNARDCFKKAIYYNPVSYDSRTQLRLLENKKELSEYFPKINLNDIIVKAPAADKYPQDNSIILLDDNQLIVYPEGAKEYHYEIAIKILNKSGIEDWKEYSIRYNSNNQKLIIDKAEVLKANNQIVKAETNNDNYVVFTNLEVNDVLHLDYRIQDMSSGKLAKHFFSNYTFQSEYPSVKKRYCILAPKDMNFHYMVRGSDLKPVITEVEDMKLYQWEPVGEPAIKEEPYMSALVDVAPTFFYSSVPDWKYISNWYKDLTYNKFNSDYVLKETVANLLKGKDNLNPYEKAKIFYNYILENITYSNVSFLHGNFVPQKASRTITTRLGDCKDVSTLYVALCREVGIKANLVLISTRNYGNKTMPLPTVDFNHCIAQLNLDGKAYYLELTDNMLPFSAALSADINSEILPIPLSDEPFGDKLLAMNMPFRPKNKIERKLDVTLSGNDMLIDHHSVFFAAAASEIRSTYRNIGSEEQLKQVNQAISSEFSVPVKVTDLNFVNLDNLEDSLIIRHKMEVSNALQDVAGMKIMKLPWSDKISSLDIVMAEDRKYPLEIWAYWTNDRTSEVIDILQPKGMRFMEIPKNVTLECANASYSLTYNASTPERLIVKRTLFRKTDQVTVQEYPAFRNFLKSVSESDNKQYAIH